MLKKKYIFALALAVTFCLSAEARHSSAVPGVSPDSSAMAAPVQDSLSVAEIEPSQEYTQVADSCSAPATSEPEQVADTCSVSSENADNISVTSEENIAATPSDSASVAVEPSEPVQQPAPVSSAAPVPALPIRSIRADAIRITEEGDVIEVPGTGRIMARPKSSSLSDAVICTDIHFRWDKYYLDETYLGNDRTLKNLAARIDSIGFENIRSIEVVSQSSPEGVVEHNMWLSNQRAATMRKYITSTYPELAGRLVTNPDGESWSQLKAYVRKDTRLGSTAKSKVLAVLNADTNPGTRKWRMEHILGTDPNVGDVYKYLYRTYYKLIRNSAIYIVFNPVALDNLEPEIVAEPVDTVAPVTIELPDTAAVKDLVQEPVDTAVVAPVVPYVPQAIQPMRAKETLVALKTNLLYDAITALNFEVEVPIGKHFSLDVEDVFPWWEFEKNKYAFQNWEMGVEGRYWFRPWDYDTRKLRGHFVGAYGMSGRGDLQIDDKPNYQVHYWSAGLTYGYSLPLGRKQWGNLEFSISAGYLAADYQHYYHSTSYDMLIRDPYDAGNVTYFGPTKAKVSLVIPLNFYTKRATEAAAKKEANNE